MHQTYLEAFLEIIIFLKEGCVIDDDLGICDPQFQNFVINSFSGFNCPDGFFKIDVK
jgi:hypothetical protein